MAVAVETSFVQISNASGVPYSGAKVNVYAAGTTTPLSVYSDSTLMSAAANPIICDADGTHPMRYIATAAYKVAVTTSAGAALTSWSKDNIDPGVAIGSGALPVANGGTGATTAGSARTNLAAAAASDMTTAQSDIANLNAWVGYTLTTRSRIATGTTAQEPVTANASFRFDSTTGRLRFDNTIAWRNVLTAGDITAADMMAGSVVQVVDATPYAANADITTVIPFDDTPPLITEGTEILTATITPKHASSIMKILVTIPIVSGTAAASQICAAVHKSTQAASIAAAAIQNHSSTNPIGFPPIYVSDTPGSVSPITYSVRFGQSASGTVRANGTTVTRVFGGVSLCQLRIIEVRG